MSYAQRPRFSPHLRFLSLIVLSLIIGLIPIRLVFAATYQVTTTTDTNDGACDAHCTLREAISAANANADDDIITFAASANGRINLTENLPPLGNNGALTIIGNGAANTVVWGRTDVRVFRVEAGSVVTLQEIAACGGYLISGGVGGGIYNSGTLTITNALICNNLSLDVGGGIYNGGTLIMTGVTVSDNGGEDSGGGIRNAGTLNLNDSLIEDNYAGRGGGITNTSSLVVTNTIFRLNQAGEEGDAIEHRYGTLSVSGSRFESNRGGEYGGALEIHAPATVTNCVFQGNHTNGWGGAIHNTSQLLVTNSVFNNNDSEWVGGALSNFGTATVINSTFNQNRTLYGYATGIDNSGVLLVTHSTFNEHIGDPWYEDFGGGIHTSTATAVVNNSIFANSTCGGALSGAGNVATLDSGCPAAEYADLLLDGLADNGGTTPTIALRLGSPAINAGDNALAVDENGAPLLTDQRGVGYPRVAQGTVDAGAFESIYERSPAAPTLSAPRGAYEIAPTQFQWNAVPGGQWYYLWVTSTAGHVFDQWYNGLAACVDGACAVPVPEGVTLTNDDYQWWVQAWSPLGGYGAWSGAAAFRVGWYAPIQIAPVGVIDTNQPTFSWYNVSGAAWYQLWVSSATATVYNSWYSAETICAADTGLCGVAPITVDNGVHQWWVQAWSTLSGYSPWSDALIFSLPLITPAPLNPVGMITASHPEFQWSAVPGASWYYLWLSDENGKVLDQWFSSAACGVDNVCRVAPVTLPAGNYRWWAQAWSEFGGYSAWSGQTDFTVSLPSRDVLPPELPAAPG